MATKSFDVAVIGGGPGGYVAGIRAGQLGKKVIVIEREHLGGVCLNWGCIPSKALIHAADVVGELGHFANHGITTGPVQVEAARLMAWKDGIIQKQRSGIKSLLMANGVEHLDAEARLTSPHTLATKPGGKALEEEIRFESVILATGAQVIELPNFPYSDERIGYARQGVSYDPLPQKLVIIGGGVIGCELGMAYAKLGVKVSIIEMLPSILPGTDPDLVRPVIKRMKAYGIEVLTEAKAKGMVPKTNEVEIEVGGSTRRLPADRVLVAVGFKPNTKGLGLEVAGVKLTDRGWVIVDDKCRTNIPHIYAIGDLTGPPLLAHRASKMGEVAAEIIAGKPSAYDVRAMPFGVFTDPEIAWAGLTEAEAKARGHEIAIGSFPMTALGRAAAMNATDGLVKVVVDKKNDVILGVAIAAQNACDLIAEACLAIEMGALSEDLSLTVHTHPTLSEGLMEAAKAAHGEAIHIINRAAGPRRVARDAPHA